MDAFFFLSFKKSALPSCSVSLILLNFVAASISTLCSSSLLLCSLSLSSIMHSSAPILLFSSSSTPDLDFYTTYLLLYSSLSQFYLSIFFTSLLNADSPHGSIRMALPHSRSLNKTATLKFVSCSQTVNLRRRGQSCGQ